MLVEVSRKEGHYFAHIAHLLPSGNKTYTVLLLSSYTTISRQLFMNVLMLVAIAGIFAFFVSYSISTRITEPIERIINYIPTLSSENFDTGMPEDLLYYTNETGKLAIAFEEMRQKLQSSFNHINDMNKSLEETVENRTKELVDLNNELENSLLNLQTTQDQLVETQKQAAIGQLVRGVAHRMNTPLGNAISTTSFLQHKLSNNPDDYQSIKTSVDIVEKSLNETRHVMDTFRLISEQGNDLKSRLFDLTYYLHQCMDIISANNQFRHLEVELEIQEGLYINSFPSTILQVLTSLTENIAEHAYPNGREGRMRLITKQVGEMMELTIVDYGVGISPELLPRVFEPFFTTKIEGLKHGLGLSIIYNQVRNKLGGTIYCESSEEATKFVINLPIK
jgi:signal transduction histidine kinase